MNQEMDYKLSDFTEVGAISPAVNWNARSLTSLATKNGQLPISSKNLDWKPLFAPGISGSSISNSRTINGLVKRSKIGGEA